MFVCGLIAGGVPTFVIATDLLNSHSEYVLPFSYNVVSAKLSGLALALVA